MLLYTKIHEDTPVYLLGVIIFKSIWNMGEFYRPSHYIQPHFPKLYERLCNYEYKCSFGCFTSYTDIAYEHIAHY